MHPPEPIYPCYLPVLGEFNRMTPHEGPSSSLPEDRSCPNRRPQAVAKRSGWVDHGEVHRLGAVVTRGTGHFSHGGSTDCMPALRSESVCLAAGVRMEWARWGRPFCPHRQAGASSACKAPSHLLDVELGDAAMFRYSNICFCFESSWRIRLAAYGARLERVLG